MNKQYWIVRGKLAHTELTQENIEALLTIRRMAKKHDRLAEMSCNGEGTVNGKWYRLDGSTPGAYISDDVTVFDVASDKLEEKIGEVVKGIKGVTVEFQGDPRGYTVKLAYNGSDITHTVLE